MPPLMCCDARAVVELEASGRRVVQAAVTCLPIARQ